MSSIHNLLLDEKMRLAQELQEEYKKSRWNGSHHKLDEFPVHNFGRKSISTRDIQTISSSTSESVPVSASLPSPHTLSSDIHKEHHNHSALSDVAPVLTSCSRKVSVAILPSSGIDEHDN